MELTTPLLRSQVLRLYRKILKEGKKLPLPTRRDYVFNKTRKEFRANRFLTNKDDITSRITFANDCLESLRVQRKHLNKIYTQNMITH